MKMKFPFIKCHGSGNTFLMIDERVLAFPISKHQKSILAKNLCNSKGETFTDGILFIGESKIADGYMTVINADGSEASMCGNGLRCVARFLSEEKKKIELKVETLGGVYECKRINDFFTNVIAYSTKIDTVSFNVKDLPLNYEKEHLFNDSLDFLKDELTVSAIAVPNPHLVSEASDTKLLKTVGEKCNATNPYFPDGTNVNFFKQILGKGIFVQTFERGVGLTNACGTGMLASAIIAAKLYHIEKGKWIEVYNPGGFVKCQVEEDGNGNYSGELLGNATYIFEGKIDFDFENTTQFTIQKEQEFKDELKAYATLKSYAESNSKFPKNQKAPSM